jgi:predicted permease
MNFADLRLRIRALFSRDAVERELEDEFQFHLEMAKRKNMAAGLEDATAALEARRQFGTGSSAKEECRDARGVNLIDSLLRDFRYALRGFRQSPAFAATVVGTIGLGLGLNTAIFTIFNAYVLRPASVHDPYSLYEFTWLNKQGRGHWFNWPEYQDFRKHNEWFSDAFAWRSTIMRFEGRPLFVELVTGNYFQVLGVNAEMGHVFVQPSKVSPGTDPVAVISHAAWVRNFGQDPQIIGRKILLRGYPFEIVGVAREGFAGINEVPHDVWIPLTMINQVEGGADFFGSEAPPRTRITGRLKPGATVKQTRAGLTFWARNLTANNPESERAVGADLRSQATAIPLNPKAMMALSPILAAFGLVLVLACANVANMLLARSMARQKEIGIRLSLGAARSRLIRQLLTECLLLALPAAAAAFILSQITIEAAQRLMVATVPPEFSEYIRVIPLHPDMRVFCFLILAAIASAVLFGLVPALQATRMDLVRAARGDFGATYRSNRLRQFLVVGQVTVCVMLLSIAALLLRGANRIENLEAGLRTRDSIEIEPREKSRGKVLEALRADAEVKMIATAMYVPLDGAAPRISITPGGDADAIRAGYNYVSGDYFSVFDLAIIRGRNFSVAESRNEAPVAVVSQRAARLLWSDDEPVGRTVRVATAETAIRDPRLARFRDARVIGVVQDAICGPVDEGSNRPCVYFPIHAENAGIFVVRVTGHAEVARKRIDAKLALIDGGAVQQIHKMDELAAGAVYRFRVAYWVSAAVGAVALLLTLSGIYGVLSYVVSRRTREIGIRVALGATRGVLMRLVFGECARMAIIGIAIGLAMGVVWTRVLAAVIVFSVTSDFVAFTGAAMVVMLACAAAAIVPMQRAVRVDPATTLRWE